MDEYCCSLVGSELAQKFHDIQYPTQGCAKQKVVVQHNILKEFLKLMTQEQETCEAGDTGLRHV